jgi:nucleotide-binding universal stress UspA family protein
MRALFCLDGTNAGRLFERVLPMLNVQALQIILLHVTDVGPSHEYERIRQRYLSLGERGAHLLAQMAQAEQERASEILASARSGLLTLLPEDTRHSAAIQTAVLRGRPEQEIVRYSMTMPVDLIVMDARRVLAPNEPPHPPGPKSVGHVARFVLDHAPCPVLLMRQ